MSALGGKRTFVVVPLFEMFSRRSLRRAAILIGCAALLLFVSLELLRRSKPDFMADDEMTYPKIISGVWVTGFEESSFFAGADAIPDRNDPRRYRVELIAGQELFDEVRHQYANPGYSAFHITFLGRRTRYPYSIDCEGGWNYSYLPDWVLQVRYLGPIADPDRPIPQPGPYTPFKRSGEGGIIRKLEDRARAHCGGVGEQ